MFDYIQKNFDFTDYQMAQLRFAFMTLASELSKALIIGLLFINKLPLFLWALFIFQLMRQATGGIHCKGYLGCLITSIVFIFLSISILPMVSISRLLQLFILLICITVSYLIGPITSDLHLPLKEEFIHKAKLRSVSIIVVYMVVIFIFSQNLFISVGFWVIFLNTLQLIIAKIGKEVSHQL